VKQSQMLKQSQIFLDNAEQCAHLAERAASQSSYRRFLRMESAWRALSTGARLA
jgi:hypothetical protein